MRPRVSFDSQNIYKRLSNCEVVAQAYGWNRATIAAFHTEVHETVTYEDAMEVIEREFEVIGRR